MKRVFTFSLLFLLVALMLSLGSPVKANGHITVFRVTPDRDIHLGQKWTVLGRATEGASRITVNDQIVDTSAAADRETEISPSQLGLNPGRVQICFIVGAVSEDSWVEDERSCKSYTLLPSLGATALPPAESVENGSIPQAQNADGSINLQLYCEAKGYTKSIGENGVIYCDGGVSTLTHPTAQNWVDVCHQVYGGNYVPIPTESTSFGFLCVPAVKAQNPTSMDGCPTGDDTFQIGTEVVVISDKPIDLRLLPAINVPVKVQIPSQTRFELLSKPLCVDGYRWYKVEFEEVIGWVTETSSDGWFNILRN